MDINERMVETAAHELNKYAYFYSLKEYARARGSEGGATQPRAFPSLAELKAAVKSGRLRPGETVEGEAFLSPYISMHHPRAHYPEMFLGDLRASVSEEGSHLPHVLPVVRLPGLPGGWSIQFLYPRSAELFQRYEHPHRLMDVLTRDYLRIPVLLPAHADYPTGWVKFRARLLEMRQDHLEEFVHLDRRESAAYAMRGLNLFLVVSGEGQGVEPLESATSISSVPRGSLFVESRIRPLPHARVESILEEALTSMGEELFPGTNRGEKRAGLDIDPDTGHHYLSFRHRLFALIYRPIIAVYRSPHFLSLYLPTTLASADSGEKEEIFERAFAWMEERMIHHGAAVEGGLPVDFTHDPCLPAWRAREILRNGLIDRVVEERPYLARTVLWLRGADLE
jgi:hypothetical protein